MADLKGYQQLVGISLFLLLAFAEVCWSRNSPCLEITCDSLCRVEQIQIGKYTCDICNCNLVEARCHQNCPPGLPGQNRNCAISKWTREDGVKCQACTCETVDGKGQPANFIIDDDRK